MTIPIEYWTDPFCVWAFVSEPVLQRICTRYQADVDIRQRIVPVFGSIVRRFATGAWSAKGREGRAEITAQVVREHRPDESVSGQVWIDDPPASSWSAALAIKAVQLLQDDGRVEVGSGLRYLTAVRHRFFVDNVNLARRDAQLALAEAQGIPVDEMVARLDDGRAMAALYEDHEDRIAGNIVGSPTYLFEGGRTRIYGNFKEEVLDATVRAYLEGQKGGGSVC